MFEVPTKDLPISSSNLALPAHSSLPTKLVIPKYVFPSPCLVVSVPRTQNTLILKAPRTVQPMSFIVPDLLRTAQICIAIYSASNILTL